MIRIVFKGFEGSESDRVGATDRIKTIADRFSDLEGHKIVATLALESGGDLESHHRLFSTKLVITGKKYNDIVLEKSGPSLWGVFAELIDGTLERLNRHGDKVRVKGRKRDPLPLRNVLSE